jgi:drug/metabolite transporter (DMT)-like permease
VISVLVVSQPIGLLVALALAMLAAGGGLDAGNAAAATAGGIAGAIALGLFYRAMAIGPMSIVAPVASLGAVVPVAVGLARGEDPATLQAVGLVLALLGVVLAVREVEHPHGVTVEPRAVLLAALSGIGFGCFFVGLDAAASQDALWAMVAARCGGSAAVIVAALAMGAALPARSPQMLGPLVVIGLLDIAANLLFALATREGLLSLVAVAGSLYPVTSVILARLVLGERLAGLQQAGVALALVGVVLIAGG